MRSVVIVATVLGLAGAGALFVLSRGEAPISQEAERLIEDARARVAAAAVPGAQAAAGDEEESGLGSWFAEADAKAARSGRQVYYQFVDDSGAVHFVKSLDQVPERWRDRAGRIEMDKREERPSAAARQPAARSGPRAAPGAPAQGQSVVVYTTSWCGWCRKTLAWLDDKGIPYENRDIERNPTYRDELIRKSGGSSIPVVEIDGNIIRGFDTKRMAQLLRNS